MSDNIHIANMHLAIELAKTSACLKLKTATVIADKDGPIATGINEVHSGKSCTDYWTEKYGTGVSLIIMDKWWRDEHREWSKFHELHAEVMALSKISKIQVKPSTVLYTVYSPCYNCAKSIIAYGIKTIYYHKVYAGDVQTINKLNDIGIKCIAI